MSNPCTWPPTRLEHAEAPRGYRVASAVLIGALAVLIVVTLLAPGLVTRYQEQMLVLGVALGIPHGAFDHVVNTWIPGRGGNVVPLHRFVAAYLAQAAVVLLGLLVAPTLVLAALLVVSVVHFARGEIEFIATRGGRVPDRLDLVGSCVGAGLVVALPLLAWPAVSERVLHLVSGQPFPIVVGPLRPLLLAGAVVATAVTAVLLVWHRRRLEAIELALVGCALLVAPPPAAFGVVFGCGHAFRHLVRMSALRPVGTGDRGIRARPLLVLAPLGVTALSGLLAWRFSGMSAEQLTLGSVLALTIPHAILVDRLDRNQSRMGRVRPPAWSYRFPEGPPKTTRQPRRVPSSAAFADSRSHA